MRLLQLMYKFIETDYFYVSACCQVATGRNWHTKSWPWGCGLVAGLVPGRAVPFPTYSLVMELILWNDSCCFLQLSKLLYQRFEAHWCSLCLCFLTSALPVVLYLAASVGITMAVNVVKVNLWLSLRCPNCAGKSAWSTDKVMGCSVGSSPTPGLSRK